jgi:hypothetical protein
VPNTACCFRSHVLLYVAPILCFAAKSATLITVALAIDHGERGTIRAFCQFQFHPSTDRTKQEQRVFKHDVRVRRELTKRFEGGAQPLSADDAGLLVSSAWGRPHGNQFE